MQLSALLDLDELQTHILLRRYLKESSQDEAALESARAANRTMDLSLDAMTSILSYYFDERIALLKSTQSILMLSVENDEFKSLTEKLIKSDLENKTSSLIRSAFALLGPSSGSFPHSTGALVPAPSSSHTPAAGLYSRMAAVTKALTSSMGDVGADAIAWLSTSHALIREQLYRESCELLSILFFIHELPRPPLGARCSGLRALELVQMGSSLFALDSSNQTPEAALASTTMAHFKSDGGTPSKLAEQMVRPMLTCAV
jgi:hypothetical protein